MEPFSALAIAAACAQFIDFGAKFIDLCRKIRDEEVVRELRELEEHAKTLTRLQRVLGKSTKAQIRLPRSISKRCVRGIESEYQTDEGVSCVSRSP